MEERHSLEISFHTSDQLVYIWNVKIAKRINIFFTQVQSGWESFFSFNKFKHHQKQIFFCIYSGYLFLIYSCICLKHFKVEKIIWNRANSFSQSIIMVKRRIFQKILGCPGPPKPKSPFLDVNITLFGFTASYFELMFFCCSNFSSLVTMPVKGYR